MLFSIKKENVECEYKWGFKKKNNKLHFAAVLLKTNLVQAGCGNLRNRGKWPQAILLVKSFIVSN